MGDAGGGAVRAATSAGDFMLDPATQLTPAETITKARTKKIVRIRFLVIITSISSLATRQFSLYFIIINWIYENNLRTGHPGHLRQGTAPTNWYDF
jgi:hypothetical protein